MRILVTGAGGYLGTILCYGLAKIPTVEVIGIDLGLFNTMPLCKEYIMDDLYTMAITPIVKGVDAIVHLAAISNDPACELDPKFTHEMNVEASERLIRAAERNGCKKFVFASTASVYGARDGLSSEDSPTIPISDYAMSKLETENRLLESYCINPIILRFGTLFGISPRMRFDLVLNLMMKDAITNNEIHVFGGSQMRPILHVSDAARAIIKALEINKPFICNVASMNVDVDYMARIVSQFTGCRIHTREESIDKRNYSMALLEMKHTLNFEPSIDIVEGIRPIEIWIRESMASGKSLEDTEYYTLKVWKEYLANGRNESSI